MSSLDSWEKIVRPRFPYIVQNLAVSELLDILYADKAVSHEDYELLLSSRFPTEQDKTRHLLLSMLLRKGEPAFKTLENALIETNQGHLLSSENSFNKHILKKAGYFVSFSVINTAW
eukprot:m.216484 g.216484  ORF g.216484 m.216484 type:complete len:117 (+) comp39869_c0_seq24:279-629(+)